MKDAVASVKAANKHALTAANELIAGAVGYAQPSLAAQRFLLPVIMDEVTVLAVFAVRCLSCPHSFPLIAC